MIVRSLDDCFFAVETTVEWMNSPTVRHDKAGQFSFSDGHVERWGWRVLNVEQSWWAPANGPNGDTLVDLKRLQDSVFFK